MLIAIAHVTITTWNIDRPKPDERGRKRIEREQFTIRASKDLLNRVREEAAAYGDSMNDLVVAAVEKEVSMRRRLRILDQIDRERLQLEKRGLHPDSAPIIRQLRMGMGRHD